MLWNDPQASNGVILNPIRGGGYLFGPDITRAFLTMNGLTHIIRGHQMQREGYEIEHDGQCITVFSAPNYCGLMNKAAILVIGRRMTFLQYDHMTFRSISLK